LIGVKDNGKIAGVRSEEELYMIESASVLYTKPQVEISSVKHQIEGKQVLEVSVNKSDRKPHSAPDENGKMAAYVRVDDQNFKANRILIRVWKKEKSEIGVKMAYSQAEKFLLDYLDQNKSITFSKFRKAAGIKPSYAEKILIDFILLKIVDISYTDNHVSYRLIELL
jgi:predicted HTH transcriptional regulator